MPDKTRLKLAALMTALFLAVVSAAGILTHSPASPVPTALPSAVSVQHPGAGQATPTPPPHEQEHD